MVDPIDALNGQQNRLMAYILRRCRNPGDANDFLQETMLRVLEQSKKREIENPVAYAYRVADTVIYAHARQSKRETEINEDEDYQCDAPLADEQLNYKQRLAAVRDGLSALPPLRRKVFIKRHIDGMSRRAIAEELGLSIEAVKKHLVRAMAKMTIILADARAETYQNKSKN